MSGSCVSPRQGWFSREASRKTGRFPVLFAAKSKGFEADFARPVVIPCGKCVNCAEAKGSALSIRCFHELQLNHGIGSFGTLTYGDESLPPDLKAARPDAEAFIKRLDVTLRRKAGAKWRGVMVGEYGSTWGRPHMHFLLFGVDLCESSRRVQTASGDSRYESAMLEQLWPHGIVDIRPITPGRAAYVGMHVIKNFHCADSFRIMSRRPGIGYGWVSQYGENLARLGFVVIEGRKLGIPAEYFNREEFRDLLEPVKVARRAYAADLPALDDPGEYQRRLSKAANVRARHQLFNGQL